MQQLVDNRYRILRPLGSGGMADVYLAHDDVLDRDVALKVLSSRYAGDEEFIERFKREAQSAAALAHPNIVSIYDRGEAEDGTYYIAMEYLPGGTLKDRILKKGPLAPDTAAAVALQIAEALKIAHNRGVVHRDIKPHNILITESGDLKVTDFGIARAASSSTMTKTGAVLGTAHYISPEQAMGEPVGPASDLYSLGVVLYEMLTGELPFDADTPIGIAMKHVNGRVRPPQEINPEIPDGINAITLKLLAKAPEQRYRNDDELIEDLERVSRGLDPSSIATTQVMNRLRRGATARTRVQPPVQRHDPKKKRRRFLPVALILLPLLALLGLAGYWLLAQAEPPPQVRVPELVDLTLEKARAQAAENFEVSVGERQNSPRQAGIVLDQSPSAGEQADKGSEITVTVSSGQNEIPDVSGASQEEAQQQLSEAGFEASIEERESEEDQAGVVIEQNPESGEVADVGSEVTIVVGTGPPRVEVPDIPYGYTEDQSRALLESVGLQLGNVTSAPNSDIAPGGVIDQNPRPTSQTGETVEEGTAVDIVLSSGPPQVEVPDVVGLNVNQAAQSIQGAGLTFTLVEAQSEEPEGTVLSTNPGAGSTVSEGTNVEITYSVGQPEPQPPQEPTSGDEERRNAGGRDPGENNRSADVPRRPGPGAEREPAGGNGARDD